MQVVPWARDRGVTSLARVDSSRKRVVKCGRTTRTKSQHDSLGLDHRYQAVPLLMIDKAAERAAKRRVDPGDEQDDMYM